MRRVSMRAGRELDPAVVAALRRLVERGRVSVSEVVHGRAA
jgi:hypothetical protein